MPKFDNIRPYYDSEVNEALCASLNHPMMKAMMQFTFPDVDDEVWKEQLQRTHSIRDFQINFVYKSIKKVLETTSEGLTTSGFEKLEPNTSYLFISNHRDIILDTSLLNVSLLEHELVMTASAIGDNLVKKDFLLNYGETCKHIYFINEGFLRIFYYKNSKDITEWFAKEKHFCFSISALAFTIHAIASRNELNSKVLLSSLLFSVQLFIV